MDPGEGYAPPLAAKFAGVLGDPGAWAKKCVEYGADIISLQLKSTDPNDLNASPEKAAETVGKVLDAINVPLIVMGVDNKDKDVEVLSVICEKFNGKNLIIGPVTEKDYKQLGAQALAYGHSIVAKSPIDVNLAKQLNILLMDLGVTADKILIDPTISGLGYGLEYTYSIMERINMAALVQQDDKLQQPIIAIIGDETWKVKECNTPTEGNETMGDWEARAVQMEVTTAVSFLAAGAQVILCAHPDALKLTKAYIDAVVDGGPLKAEGFKEIPITVIPDAEKPAEAAAPPAAEAAPEAAPEPKAAEAKPEPAPEPKAAEAKPEPAPEPKAEAKPKAKPKAKAKAEAAPEPKAAEAAPAPEPKAAEAAPEAAPKPAPKPAPKAKPEAEAGELKVPEYPIAAQIMADLERVHMRIPKY
jgi:acetyl-CoA decarbonylase/synthase complex subunit delta